MNTPLVSVLMAVYNAGPYLEQALNSILAQTFTDFELIVIDDASTDHTAVILDSCKDSRLTRLMNLQNMGLTRSLNKGLKMAKGEFIARHDADDISHPDRFRQQVTVMTEQPGLGLLGTSYQIIDWCGQILDTVLLPATNPQLQNLLPDKNLFCHGSVMLRRDVLEKVGGYNEAFPVTQDYDLWLRVAEHCEMANLSNPLYQFRFDGGTISQRKTNLQLAYERLARELAIQRRTIGIEEKIPEDVLRLYPPESERLVSNIRWATYCFYLAGQMDQAAGSLARAEKILLQSEVKILSWEAWAWSQARQLVELRNDVTEGTKFIAWVFKTLSPTESWLSAKPTIGRLYADRAFLAHQNGSKKQILPYAWQAIRCDWSWLRNRGLWAISWRSLCQK